MRYLVTTDKHFERGEEHIKHMVRNSHMYNDAVVFRHPWEANTFIDEVLKKDPYCKSKTYVTVEVDDEKYEIDFSYNRFDILDFD